MNKSKDKGTKGETQVVNYLLAHGIDAQRRALSGNKDKGDIEVKAPARPWPFIIEVKSGKQTQNYSRKLKEEWIRQTRTEAENAGSIAFLVINTYGKNIADAEVWSDIGDYFWYLDKFTEWIGGKD